MSVSDPLVSAQVILRPAGGSSAAPDTITSRNVHEVMPSTAAAADAREAFIDLGFDVGEVVGNSFSIAAPASAFEKKLKTKLERDAKTGAVSVARSMGDGTEVPTGALPPRARQAVAAIVFTPPPDFGPTSY